MIGAARHIQVFSGSEGVEGFKLTGRAREGSGLVRIWLRRANPWDRYLNPRLDSEKWDVRAYQKLDSAFAFVPEFSIPDLEWIAESYEFTEGGEQLASLSANGDPVHDRVLAWARGVTGAGELAAAPPVSPAAPQTRTWDGPRMPVQRLAPESAAPIPTADVAQTPIRWTAPHSVVRSEAPVSDAPAPVASVAEEVVPVSEVSESAAAAPAPEASAAAGVADLNVADLDLGDLDLGDLDLAPELVDEVVAEEEAANAAPASAQDLPGDDMEAEKTRVAQVSGRTIALGAEDTTDDEAADGASDAGRPGIGATSEVEIVTSDFEIVEEAPRRAPGRAVESDAADALSEQARAGRTISMTPVRLQRTVMTAFEEQDDVPEGDFEEEPTRVMGVGAANRVAAAKAAEKDAADNAAATAQEAPHTATGTIAISPVRVDAQVANRAKSSRSDDLRARLAKSRKSRKD